MRLIIRPTKRFLLIQELNDRPEFFPEDPLENPEERFWFLAKIGRDVVGWCGMTIRVNGEAEIYRTGVLPEFQSRGIKRKMVAVMERHAKRLGCTVMKSYCSTDNVPSANSLIRSGYRIYWPMWEYTGGPWIYWKKQL
jgi:RimJ/RimL family protein N-acetyltransferase